MYIFFDTETGGIGLDKSLLTAFFLVTDDLLRERATLSLHLKPDDGVYHVTGEAMGINKIDLAAHDKVAIPYGKAGAELYAFLRLHSNDGKEKLIPVGHNVRFDIEQITDKIVARNTWEHFVSYRTLDTGVIAQFFKLCQVVGFKEIPGSLTSLANLYGVTPNELGGDFKTAAAHNAEFDTRTTRVVLDKLSTYFIDHL